jgi:type IV secretion system protein VirD4
VSFAENGLAILFIAAIFLGVLALVGWWAYKKIYYSRYLTVRRNNKEALEEFGADQATRERNIVEAFNSGDYPLKLRGENRNKNYMMNFVLTKPVGTFKRQDLECIRFAYFAFNRGLIDEERFYTYRITAMYQGGMTDPSEFDYIGWLAFWHRRKKQGEIGRARGAVQGFAAANCTPNLQNQTFAALQSLMAKYPNDEFFIDMWQRFRGGARWLGLGDIKRSAFAVPERPTPYYVHFGTLDGTSTMLTYSGDGSILTVAPPGQGKTTCNVIPNLLRWPGAAIVLDVKGEIYDLTSKYRSTIGPVIKFSPLDPEHSKCYNPLAFVRREPLYVWEDASNAANMMIVPGQGGDKNKFFEDSARDVLTAIIADVAYWHKPEDRPMGAVLSILNRNGWDEFLERLRKNPEVSAMQDLGVSLAKEHPETLSNILSFARSSMNSWKGERISMITKRSDWHPLDLRSGKHPTIYICINSEDIETYASLLRVFIAQHINLLMSQKVPAQGAEPILFCLDEFPRLGGMKPIETALAVGRGYKIRLWLFAQDFLQIEKAYTNAHAIMNLCLVRSFMNPTVEGAAKIAEEIGKEGVSSGADDQSTVSPQELAGPSFENLQIVVGASSKPAKVRKMPYYKNAELMPRVGSLDDEAGSGVTERSAIA